MPDKKEVIIPAELAEILETDAEAKEFFESLSDGYKRGYCDWTAVQRRKPRAGRERKRRF